MPERQPEPDDPQNPRNNSQNSAEDNPEADPEIPSSSDMKNTAEWGHLLARTEANIAAARALLKDAGNVTLWSQVLGRKIEQRREQKKQQENKQNTEQGAAPARSQQTSGPQAGGGEGAAAPFAAQHCLVVRLERDLSLQVSPQLARLFQTLAAEEGGAESKLPVVLDLRGIGSVDTSGVSALIQGHKALTGSRRRLLVLLAPGSQPERVFQEYSLAMIIPRIHSLDAL